MSDLTFDSRIKFKERLYKSSVQKNAGNSINLILKIDPKIVLTADWKLGHTNQILMLDFTFEPRTKVK